MDMHGFEPGEVTLGKPVTLSDGKTMIPFTVNDPSIEAAKAEAAASRDIVWSIPATNPPYDDRPIDGVHMTHD